MKTKDKQKKAIKLLEAQGLLYASTPKQKENGTLYFVDPKTMTGYSITKSGYCRRHKGGYYGDTQYQLNKTTRAKVYNYTRRKSDSDAFSYWTTTGRILEPGKYVKLAKQLLGPIRNWRKNN